MQASKQSDPDLVVWNLRLRGRLAPFSALVAVCVIVPFLPSSASSATSAAGARNVVLAAAAPAQVLPGDEPAPVESARNSRATGGQMAFPDIALPALTGAGGGAGARGDALIAGPTGPVYGSVLLRSAMVSSAGFIRPVNAPEMSSFGPRVHPVLGRAMFHTGIDLGAACSTPIQAAADGTVVYAAQSPSWGNRVIIAHSPTLKTAYGHQSQMLVKTGAVVKQGQVIGLVGTTGWSTGCHLHFDVIVKEEYVDPAPYLGLAGRNASVVPFFAPAPGRPGDGAAAPVLKNDKPPVPDGDVPLSAAKTKKAVKPSQENKPAAKARPSSTPPRETQPAAASTSGTKPTTASASSTPPPTSTPSSSSTTKLPTTSPPPTTTTTSPPSTTTTTTNKPTTGTSSSAPSAPSTSPTPTGSASEACPTTLPDEAAEPPIFTPPPGVKPVVEPDCAEAKLVAERSAAASGASTSASTPEPASEAVTP